MNPGDWDMFWAIVAVGTGSIVAMLVALAIVWINAS